MGAFRRTRRLIKALLLFGSDRSPMLLSLVPIKRIEISDPEGITRFENCSFIHFNCEIARPANTRKVDSTFGYNGHLSIYLQKYTYADYCMF